MILFHAFVLVLVCLLENAVADPFIAEIKMFGGNFAPRGWAFCDGRLIPIAQNTALFSLIGTIYGGDGRTTFALPDLRGRVPIHAGSGAGLSNYRLGERSGVESVTLNPSQIPSHSHSVQTHQASVIDAGVNECSVNDKFVWTNSGEGTTSSNTQNTGGGQPVENRQPYLAVNYIIALEGIFPSRS